MAITFDDIDIPINYAEAMGIHSFRWALAFCLIYVVLFVIFVMKWVRNTVYVLGATVLFCIIRFTAFGMRAALARSSSLAQNRNVIIAESIIYSTGFFGILSGAYGLVLYRDEAIGTKNRVPLRCIIGNRHIMRLAMMVAVVIGIVGTVDTEDPTKTNEQVKVGTHLRKTSAIMFLVICILMVIYTLFSIMAERKIQPAEKTYAPSFGHSHGMKVLLFTALFLTLRESFFVVTMNDITKQLDEKLFYPFAAGTELVAVLTLLIPQLVPPIHALPQ